MMPLQVMQNHASQGAPDGPRRRYLEQTTGQPPELLPGKCEPPRIAGAAKASSERWSGPPAKPGGQHAPPSRNLFSAASCTKMSGSSSLQSLSLSKVDVDETPLKLSAGGNNDRTKSDRVAPSATADVPRSAGIDCADLSCYIAGLRRDMIRDKQRQLEQQKQQRKQREEEASKRQRQTQEAREDAASKGSEEVSKYRDMCAELTARLTDTTRALNEKNALIQKMSGEDKKDGGGAGASVAPEVKAAGPQHPAQKRPKLHRRFSFLSLMLQQQQQESPAQEGQQPRPSAREETMVLPPPAEPVAQELMPESKALRTMRHELACVIAQNSCRDRKIQALECSRSALEARLDDARDERCRHAADVERAEAECERLRWTIDMRADEVSAFRKVIEKRHQDVERLQLSVRAQQYMWDLYREVDRPSVNAGAGAISTEKSIFRQGDQQEEDREETPRIEEEEELKPSATGRIIKRRSAQARRPLQRGSLWDMFGFDAFRNLDDDRRGPLPRSPNDERSTAKRDKSYAARSTEPSGPKKPSMPSDTDSRTKGGTGGGGLRKSRGSLLDIFHGGDRQGNDSGNAAGNGDSLLGIFSGNGGGRSTSVPTTITTLTRERRNKTDRRAMLAESRGGSLGTLTTEWGNPRRGMKDRRAVLAESRGNSLGTLTVEWGDLRRDSDSDSDSIGSLIVDFGDLQRDGSDDSSSKEEHF